MAALSWAAAGDGSAGKANNRAPAAARYQCFVTDVLKNVAIMTTSLSLPSGSGCGFLQRNGICWTYQPSVRASLEVRVSSATARLSSAYNRGDRSLPWLALVLRPAGDKDSGIAGYRRDHGAERSARMPFVIYVRVGKHGGTPTAHHPIGRRFGLRKNRDNTRRIDSRLAVTQRLTCGGNDSIGIDHVAKHRVPDAQVAARRS